MSHLSYALRLFGMTPSDFWALVAHGHPEACWLWQGQRQPSQYGRLSYNGRRVGAHRLAWELAKGQPVPAGLSVCHRCDNPPCCNPMHLFVGTAQDNHRDREAKGRGGNSSKQHCPQGHSYADAIHTAAGGRVCRTCTKERNARAREHPEHRAANQATSKAYRDRNRPDRGLPNAAKTHCAQGHEFTEANTRVKPNGHRHCRECDRLRAVRSRAARSQTTTGSGC